MIAAPIPPAAVYGLDDNSALVRQAPESLLFPPSPIDVLSAATITRRAVAATVSTQAPTIQRNQLEEMQGLVVAELRRYESFEQGWDGYLSETFSPRAVARSIDIVLTGSSFLRRSGVQRAEIIPGPASDGSIDVEFRSGGKTLIISVGPSGSDFAIYAHLGEWSSSEPASSDFSPVVRWLSWLAGPSGIPPHQAPDLRYPA